MIAFDLEFGRGDLELRASLETTAPVSGLFGPTGSGKTSLLLAVAGLLPEARGRVDIDGVVVQDTARKIFLPPEERRLGFVFQDGRLFPHLTVRENLVFSRPPADAPGPGLEEVVNLLDLAPLLERPVTQLSGGQSRLVAIGRALMARPRLLLLDEPMTGLDPALRRRVLAYLLRLKRSSTVSMLLVSHVYADFLAMVDEAAVLHGGRLEKTGRPEEWMARALEEETAGPVETTLTGTVLRMTNNEAEVECSGTRFILSLPGAAAGDRVLVTVGAEEILAGVGEPPRTSARNVLPGTVTEVIHAGSRILLEVNAGPRVWAEITEASLRSLDLAVGSRVYLLIKATSLRGYAYSAPEPAGSV